MKRIIYTAVALIICASVFGIADYFNAKKKGALVNYTDETQTTEAVVSEKKVQPTAIAEEKTAPKKELKEQVKSEKKIAKSKVNEAHYTAIVPSLVVTENTKEPVAEKVDPLNTVLQSKATDVNNDSIIQTSGKRKISMEMFSRAPIREKKVKK